MTSVDLNCDLGEGFPHDGELMPLISSANVACGGHAGDPVSMSLTVALAREHAVAIGAHPGFVDRVNFGRREIAISPRELQTQLEEQIAALCAQGRVRHVKPHGGLYTLAARERAVAETVVAAVRAVDSSLILFGLAGSELVRAGWRRGLRVAEEAFGDRRYRPDGSLLPRGQPGALIESEEASAAQVLRIVREGVVRAIDGTDVPLRADTICLHGDSAGAVGFARRLRRELEQAGVTIQPAIGRGAE